jgi:SAM-dependent methyltransferase
MQDPLVAADARFKPVQRSKTFNRILDILGLRTKKVFDMGCGYGEYLVHFGEGSMGITTTVAEVEYGKQRDIDIIQGNVELIDQLGALKDQHFEAMWANNLFEHLLSPHAYLIKLKLISTDDALLVLGVPVVPRIASLMKLGKFRGALAGAHINFFTRETLSLTVARAGWHVRSVRPFVFSNYTLDMLASFFAPHLYVVAENDSSFTYPTKKLKEWKDDEHYKQMLEITRSS